MDLLRRRVVRPDRWHVIRRQLHPELPCPIHPDVVPPVSGLDGAVQQPGPEGALASLLGRRGSPAMRPDSRSGRSRQSRHSRLDPGRREQRRVARGQTSLATDTKPPHRRARGHPPPRPTDRAPHPPPPHQPSAPPNLPLPRQPTRPHSLRRHTSRPRPTPSAATPADRVAIPPAATQPTAPPTALPPRWLPAPPELPPPRQPTAPPHPPPPRQPTTPPTMPTPTATPPVPPPQPATTRTASNRHAAHHAAATTADRPRFAVPPSLCGAVPPAFERPLNRRPTLSAVHPPTA